MSRVSEFCLQGTSVMRSILSRWLMAATVAGSALVLAQPAAPHAMPASAYIVQSHGAQSAVRYHAAQHLAHPLGYIVDGAVKIDLDVKPQI